MSVTVHRDGTIEVTWRRPERNPRLEAALSYAERGWNVFPLDGKRPFAGTRGYKDATTDLPQIRAWWRGRPRANVGIATGRRSGLVVVDVDGPAGERALRELLGSELVYTQEARTGKKGRHVYFRYPRDGRVPTVHGLRPTLDVQSDGAYVVAPPSLHPETRRRYRWTREAMRLPTLPTPIRRAVAERGRPEPVRLPETIAEGARDQTLFRAGCAMRAKGFTEPEILAALEEVNDARCDPPLDDAQVVKIAASAARYDATADVFRDADGAAHASRTLREILANPEALKPPEPLIPRFAWRGRVTLYSAPDKSGKSTLIAAACAAATRGEPFLDAPTAPVSVLLLRLEEHVGDLAVRAERFGTDPDRLRVIEIAADPEAVLREEVERYRPDVIIVDPLVSYARAVTSSGDSRQWRPVMETFLALARRFDAAVIVLHHARKSDGQARDSGDITAAVDVVIEQTKRHEEGVQRFDVRGRWAQPGFAVWLADDRYVIHVGEPPLEQRILAFLAAHPRSGFNALREGVAARASDVRAALDALAARDVVRNEGSGQRQRWVALGTRVEIDGDTVTVRST